ncbi:MAG: hypothetical protein V2B20_28115 [Pseudomonadota bacterium]
MQTKLEVATIKANTPPLGELQVYWILSRNQLEFILQDITVVRSPQRIAMAPYLDILIPVINLEQHFGLRETERRKSVKYLVIRAVTSGKSLVKVIIETAHVLKMQTLETGFAAASPLLSLPKNNDDHLGMYSMPDGSIGIVPDVAGITRSLKRGEGGRPV